MLRSFIDSAEALVRGLGSRTGRSHPASAGISPSLDPEAGWSGIARKAGQRAIGALTWGVFFEELSPHLTIVFVKQPLATELAVQSSLVPASRCRRKHCASRLSSGLRHLRPDHWFAVLEYRFNQKKPEDRRQHERDRRPERPDGLEQHHHNRHQPGDKIARPSKELECFQHRCLIPVGPNTL